MNKQLYTSIFSFLFLLATMTTSSLHAQLNLIWQKTYGVSTANEQGSVIQALPNGGFVVTYDLQVGGSGPLGNQYVTAVAYDANGNISWEKNLGGPGSDFANDILVEANGDMVIIGQSNSNVGVGFPDLWVVKLDSQGNILWEVFYGGSKADLGTSISRTNDGGYFIAGRTSSNDGDVLAVIPDNVNNAGMWAVKLDQNGALEWNEVYFGLGVFLNNFYGYQTTDGGYLIGGSAFGSGGDVPVGNGDYDYWIIKTDAQRNIVWSKSYGGIGPEILYSIRPTADGGSILSGDTNSSVSGDISERFGSKDYWIVKLDQMGNLLWEKSLGGTDSDVLPTAIEVQNDQILVTGRSNSSDGLVGANNGESDIWVVALDGNGQLLAEQNFGGSSFELPAYISLSSNGIYIAGYTRSSDGDVTGFSGSNLWDGWILEVEYDPSNPTDIDLSLNMTASQLTPAIYSNTAISLTITNSGSANASGIEVAFPKPADVVYSGGNEWTATQGSFVPFGNETWAVGSLAPGASATLTVNYFMLTSDERTAYAQVTAASGNDSDSSPGNGTCCMAVEDDEAAVTLNFSGGNPELICPGDITLSSQAEVNAWPGCTIVEGNLSIFGNDITDLSPLTTLQKVRGGFLIEGNLVLNDLSGLENLDSVEALIIAENDQLTHLDGLNLSQTEIATIGIYNNDNLQSISGLNNFTETSGNVEILSNDNLVSITGLNGLTTIGDNLLIEFNTSLTNLDGFANLVTIEDNFQLIDQESLTQINGLGNLNTVKENFIILSNANLESLNGLNNLTNLHSIVVVGNSMLENLGVFSSISAISGYINILDNVSLADCCGLFPMLDGGGVAGAITIDGNPMPCSNEQDILDDPNCSGGSQLPDLIPQGVVAPLTSVQAGGVAGFGVNFVAANVGGPLLPGQEPFRARLYLSADDQLSNDDIQIGGNMILGLGTASLGGPVPISTAPGQYFALLFLDADEEVPESNEDNNVQAASQLITVTPNTGGGDIDLALSLFQNSAAPAQWSNYTIIATISNEGGATATGVRVHFPKPDGVVYTGGSEWDATQGSFNPFGNEEWEVGSIPAGETASLTVSYFLLDPDSPEAYAQVSAANETDGDSTPGNGTPPTVNEDDEASTGGGGPPFLQPDLVLIDLDIENSPVEAGQALNYNFDASNIGTGPAPNDFVVKAYISTDEILSNDDIQDGIIPTGNFGTGLTLPNIPGASAIPANLTPGNYFLILKIDADEEVAESNEFNNVISAPFAVSDGGNGGPSCSFTTYFTPSGFDPLEITYGRDFEFTEDANGYQIIQGPRPYVPVVPAPVSFDTYELDLTGNVVSAFATPIVPTIDVALEVVSNDTIEMIFNLSPDLPAGTAVLIDLGYPNPTAAVFLSGQALRTSSGYAFGVGIVDLSLSPNIVNRIYMTDHSGQNVTFADLPDPDFFFGTSRIIEGPDGSLFSDWRTSGNYSLFVIPGDGSAPWQARVASDTPSSSWIETEISHDGHFVYTMKTDNSQTFVAKYQVSDGTQVGVDLADLKISPDPTGFRQTWAHGIEPTADGGLLVSLFANEFVGSGPDFEVLAKYDAANNLVWKQEIPDPDFELTPVGETTDGGALFAGSAGSIGSPADQTVFLKTAAGGALMPECGGGSGSGVDLELSMSASNPNPAIYSDTEITLTVNNTGSEPATGVTIRFPKPGETVYTGGNEWSATQGNFVPFGNEEWNVGEVPAGGSASISVNYFVLTEDALTPYAQVNALNETDTDSSPGNGICCTPLEDDEATILINGFNSGGGISLKSPDRFRLLFDNIYPNPAKYFVTMEIFAPKSGAGTIELYDQAGRQVLLENVFFEKGNNIFQISVSELRSGFYNVIGRADGHPAYGRFAKVWED
ncbi:MAG: CARDB domain-containing protein [Bacteroidota bacterium]